jgi:hypothetical protein
MVISGLVGAVALVFAAIGWVRRRQVFGAGVYVVAALSAAVWCWAIAAFDAFDRAGHYPYPVVALWLAAVSSYVGAVFVMARRAVSTRWSPSRVQLAILVLEPVAIFLLEVTNQFHHLVGTRQDGAVKMGVAYGVHTAYCIALVLAAVAFLTARRSQSDQAQKRWSRWSSARSASSTSRSTSRWRVSWCSTVRCSDRASTSSSR